MYTRVRARKIIACREESPACVCFMHFARVRVSESSVGNALPSVIRIQALEALQLRAGRCAGCRVEV